MAWIVQGTYTQSLIGVGTFLKGVKVFLGVYEEVGAV